MKTKRERFEEIATKRVNKVLYDLDSLVKCANRNNYEYTEEDVKKMTTVIRKKLRNVDEAFRAKMDNGNQEFKF
jgi:FKBP-type peptidyl-prolyl cis-trans isomerase (trigger factor)